MYGTIDSCSEKIFAKEPKDAWQMRKHFISSDIVKNMFIKGAPTCILFTYILPYNYLSK
jgi:hypothetical protein